MLTPDTAPDGTRRLLDGDHVLVRESGPFLITGAPLVLTRNDARLLAEAMLHWVRTGRLWDAEEGTGG